MPKFDDPDQKFPKRNNGSLLKTAVAATPLTIGVASALKGIHIDGSIKQPREAGIDQAMRTLARSKNAKGPPIPSVEQVHRFMSQQSAGVNRQAWQWAQQSIDPFTRNRLLTMTENIGSMTSSEARSAIANTLASNESDAMGTVWNRFQRNVGLLESQIKITGQLPQFTRVDDLWEFAHRGTASMPKSALPEQFQQGLQRITTALGQNASFSPWGLTRPEVASEGFGVWNVTFKGTGVGEFKVSIPQISGGMLLEGSELQTRRIAPDFLMPNAAGELQRFNRSEFFLKELEESIVPDIGGRLKTQRDVEQAVKQLKGKVFGELETTPNVLSATRTASAAQREAQRGMAVDLVIPEEIRKGSNEYRPGFRAPTVDETRRALGSTAGQAMGLTGGIGPKGLSQGRLSTVDWERFYIGKVDYGRRPEQMFREFQITEQSMRSLGQYEPNQKFKALQMIGDDIAYENVARPKLKTLYVDPAQAASYGMGEGEAILRSKTGSLMQFEEAKTARLMDFRTDISNFKNIKGGELLGLTPEGKEFVLPKDASISNVRNIGKETVVEYTRLHQLRHGSKLFGGAKAVTSFRGEKEFGDILSGLQATTRDVDLIASMDELKKNKALHRRQIVDSLTGMLEQRMAAPSSPAQAAFMTDPARFAQRWTKGSHQEFIEKAMGFALRDTNIEARQFGQVFGAVPYVLGAKTVQEKGIPEMVARALPRDRAFAAYGAEVLGSMKAGMAVGMPEFAFGGARLEVGGMGSLESRAFEILRSSMGKTGEGISAEFAQRLAATSPETMMAHKEIQKTLASIGGESVTGLAAKQVYSQGRDFQKFIEAGGGIISAERAGMNIYVPGADVMSQLRPHELPTGRTTTGKLSDIYSNIAYKASLLENEQLTVNEFRAEVEKSGGLLAKEWAPAGKGAGGIGRGKVLGSRFLRGVSTQTGGAATAIKEAQQVGVTQGTFQSMMKEMMGSGLLSDQEKERMKAASAAFGRGEAVPGMLGRHPFIGSYSLQPVEMIMTKGEDDLITLPEIRRSITAKGFDTPKTITLGPLVGMAGDKDADAYSLFMVGPRNQEAIRKNALVHNSDYLQRYTQHQVRMQLFKAGKAAGGAEIPNLKQMMADVEKLAVGQKWIAPLSLEMTSSKAAIGKFGEGAAAADARFLLEWLEQTPISAKHLTASQAGEGGLQSLMESVTASMQERNAARLESNIRSIVKDDTVANSMLTKNIVLDKTSSEEIARTMNIKAQQRIASIDIKATTQYLMRMMSESDRTGYTRELELMAGRGPAAKMKEIAQLGAGAWKGQPNKSVFGTVSAAAIGASNKLGSLGAGVIRHHKAIGLGFAGTLALGAVLSSPPQSVGSGRAKIPNSKLNMNRTKGANRMRPENLHPPGESVGNPTAPQLVRNQTVRLSQAPKRTNSRISVRAPSGANIADITAGLSRLGGTTSVNLRDNRSSNSSYSIANKLL